MLNRTTILVFVLCVFSLESPAQLAMGEWRTHFSYNSVTQITQSENKIFALSDGALFSVDKQDEAIQFYNKTNGLNGTYISQIEYDSINKTLLIAYSDGNIDLIEKNGISNVPDFLNKQMIIKKDVNHIYFNQNKAYLSCNFGILVINLIKKEVADTYIIGPNASDVKVLSTCITNDKIYALTPTTIYTASISNPNLVNYEFWSTLQNLPAQGETMQSLKSFNGNLFLQAGNKLYKYDGTNWTTFLTGENVNYFSISANKMIVSVGKNSIFSFDENLISQQIAIDTLTSDVELDQKYNKYWFAANTLGVLSRKQITNETPQFSYFKPSGPALNSPWDMIFENGKLYVVPGGRWSAQYKIDGAVMIFEDERWINIFNKTFLDNTNHKALDFMNTAVDPLDRSHFFVTSYGTGLYEFKNNELVNWHNHLNSKLETAVPENPFEYIRMDGAVFDKDGNLWMNNIGKIKILMKNGEFETIDYPEINKPTLGKILISNQNPNHKWIPSVRYTPGICILDDNGTITNLSDDNKIFLSSFPDIENNGEPLSPRAFYCTAQDKNGVIWVGTDNGPLIFNNPTKVFEPSYRASRIKIPRNDQTNYADYLLENEKIKSIAIDGANRKWLGTESSGVYLMSENGQETIEHFTSSNSPLISNDIVSIAINPLTGEVFFGSSLGLLSYQSDAIEADNKFGDVHAYPNPVRENFAGAITITGLVDDTQVKITDLSGNLICQTVSNGSIATWDGKDLQGRKVNTGIYFAICVSSDGTQSTITKIMVIN